MRRAVSNFARPLARQAVLSKRAYHENVIDHYEKPRNVGSLDKEDPRVGTGLVGAPACGDVMKLQIKVSEDGTVEEAVFKVCMLQSPSTTCHVSTETEPHRFRENAKLVRVRCAYM